MKNFLVRLLLAAALTLVAFALISSAQAQQADEDRGLATAPRQQQSDPSPDSPQQTGAPAPSANDARTQQALSFTGNVANEQGRLVLQDPVTKMRYRLDDQSKVRPYIGKQVKVIGKLEM